jgi:hypothetical protein
LTYGVLELHSLQVSQQNPFQPPFLWKSMPYILVHAPIENLTSSQRCLWRNGRQLSNSIGTEAKKIWKVSSPFPRVQKISLSKWKKVASPPHFESALGVPAFRSITTSNCLNDFPSFCSEYCGFYNRQKYIFL